MSPRSNGTILSEQPKKRARTSAKAINAMLPRPRSLAIDETRSSPASDKNTLRSLVHPRSSNPHPITLKTSVAPILYKEDGAGGRG